MASVTRRGGIILDAFTGSGTTLIAADNAGRRGYGIELDPYYVDTTLMRLREKDGIEPRLSTIGERFTDLQQLAST